VNESGGGNAQNKWGSDARIKGETGKKRGLKKRGLPQEGKKSDESAPLRGELERGDRDGRRWVQGKKKREKNG